MVNGDKNWKKWKNIKMVNVTSEAYFFAGGKLQNFGEQRNFGSIEQLFSHNAKPLPEQFRTRFITRSARRRWHLKRVQLYTGKLFGFIVK